jgi:hypothetical protein
VAGRGVAGPGPAVSTGPDEYPGIGAGPRRRRCGRPRPAVAGGRRGAHGPRSRALPPRKAGGRPLPFGAVGGAARAPSGLSHRTPRPGRSARRPTGRRWSSPSPRTRAGGPTRPSRPATGARGSRPLPPAGAEHGRRRPKALVAPPGTGGRRPCACVVRRPAPRPGQRGRLVTRPSPRPTRHGVCGPAGRPPGTSSGRRPSIAASPLRPAPRGGSAGQGPAQGCCRTPRLRRVCAPQAPRRGCRPPVRRGLRRTAGPGRRPVHRQPLHCRLRRRPGRLRTGPGRGRPE